MAVRARLELSAGGPARLDIDLNGPDDVIRAGVGSDLGLRLLVVVAGDAVTGIRHSWGKLGDP